MEYIYLGIICFLFILAVIDLNVGVSNDAVNFLNSAVGAKAASLRTILIVAAIGIFIGASTSNGMMDIARHGMFQPEHFYFRQVMCIFLAVTVTDVVLLDIFNSLGMPTSTTVSMVFELLGASFALAIIKVNVFKVIIMVGTFALAMAFAGNDLVNFIGVTMAALDSVLHFFKEGLAAGFTPDTYKVGFLNDPATTSIWFLIGAGAIMVFALCTSKKAHEVLKTSINLSRQDEGDEMFGSSSLARRLVRMGMGFVNGLNNITPSNVKKWVNGRFNQSEVTIDEGAAFDLVRASVNLVLAGLLIALGTSLKLPLSTTYVTFMVGMGSSLADRAWGRETAVFRITGVISVIGGWFLTAGAAFILAGLVATINYVTGPIGMLVMVALAIFLLIRSHISYKNKATKEVRDEKMDIILTSEDPERVWSNLKGHTAETLCHTLEYAADTYEGVISAFANEDVRKLRSALGKIVEEKAWLKQMRRKETLGFRRIDKGLAFEKNTWYYLSSNNAQQILNTLTRITNPMKEHTDNNFRPLSPQYYEEFAPYQKRLIEVFRGISRIIRTGDYTDAEKLSAEGKWLKKEISNLRRVQTHRLQEDAENIKVAFVYLNLIQESHELLSEVRNVLRGCEKYFIDQKGLSVEEANL